MTTSQQLMTEEQADFSPMPERRSARGWIGGLAFALIMAALIGAAYPARAPFRTPIQQPASDSVPPRMTRVAAARMFGYVTTSGWLSMGSRTHRTFCWQTSL